MRIANRPRRGSATPRSAGWSRMPTPWGSPSSTRSTIRGGGAGACVRACRARLSHAARLAPLGCAGAADRRAARGRPRALGHDRGVRGRAHDRGARTDREPPGAGRGRARVPAAHRGSVAVRLSAGDLLVSTRTSCAARRSRHADDHPQREGPGVPRRVRDRPGGGRLPTSARSRRTRWRRSGDLLRRDDAGDGAPTLTHAMARTLWGRRSYNLQSRFLDELPSEVEHERLRPALVVVVVRL